jgi:hypothetical protein
MGTNRPLAVRLCRHLATCAVVASAAQHANADIVYSGVRDLNIPSTNAGVYINVITGASSSAGGSSVPGWDVNPWQSTALGFFNPTAPTGGVYARVTAAVTGVSNLTPGTSIGATTLWTAGNAQTTGTNPFVLNGDQNIVGFRFTNESGGTVHYGWMRIRLSGTLSAQPRTVVDWAYESIPNTPIPAGSTGGPPPAYDPCSTSNPTAAVGTNTLFYRSDATVADVSACGATVHRANIYRFTAVDAGSYTFATCPTSGAARMALLSNCSSGSVLACGTPSCGSGSSITTTLDAGGTVWVAIGGATADAQLGTSVPLVVTAPPIAACVNATSAPFGISPFSNEGQTVNQTVRASTTAATSIIHKAAWYKFVPGVNGLYTFSLCGSVNDTKIAIGTICPAAGQTFQSLAYNDDTCTCSSGCGTTTQFDYSSKLGEGQVGGILLNTELTAGTTYYIVVGGFGADTAAVSGNLEITGPPQPSCRPDLNDDTFVDGNDLGILLGQWGPCSTECAADFNDDGFVDGNDLGVLLAAWGACP